MNAKSNDFILSIEKHADNYIAECLANTKEVVSGSGKVIEYLFTFIEARYNSEINLLCLVKVRRRNQIEHYKKYRR